MKEHKINVKRFIWNRSDGERFEFIEELEHDMCELSKQHLTIVDSPEINKDSRIEKIEAFVCLIKNRMETDYDYDYEDNITVDYYEATDYIPIKFCPFCGATFVVDIIEEIDVSEKLNPIWEEYSSLNKGRSSDAKRKKQNELYKKMYDEKYRWILIDK